VRIPGQGERDFRREGERFFALPWNRFHNESGMISTGMTALDITPAQ